MAAGHPPGTEMYASSITRTRGFVFRGNSATAVTRMSHITSELPRTSHVRTHGSGRHPPGSALTTENHNRNMGLRVVVTLLQDDMPTHVGSPDRAGDRSTFGFVFATLVASIADFNVPLRSTAPNRVTCDAMWGFLR